MCYCTLNTAKLHKHYVSLLQYCLQCPRNTLHLGVRRSRTMQDEAVAHFVLVTGADAKTAEGLIEVYSLHLRCKTHV